MTSLCMSRRDSGDDGDNWDIPIDDSPETINALLRLIEVAREERMRKMEALDSVRQHSEDADKAVKEMREMIMEHKTELGDVAEEITKRLDEASGVLRNVMKAIDDSTHFSTLVTQMLNTLDEESGLESTTASPNRN